MNAEMKKNTSYAKNNEENSRMDMGQLLIDTGITVASLVLFPAIGQRLGISPIFMNALKIAINKVAQDV